MISRNIYNSSGKIRGQILINDNSIEVQTHGKQNVIISTPIVIESCGTKIRNDDVIRILYDKYTLTIGEIASIFDVHYHVCNKWIKLCETCSSKYSGRRNASYGAKFSENRRRKIGEHSKQTIQRTRLWEYDRTKEVREKASASVKKAYERGDLDARRNAQMGWRNGKFDNVNFKRGIGGYITSKKIGKRFFFRSLLELKYILIIESDPTITTYSYEPIRIQCDDGTIYTPDILLNNDTIVELKSYNFIYKQGGKIQERFEYKSSQAKKYCDENGLTFKVIFDTDIDFKSDVMKHYLEESNVVEEYNIEFLQPERVWSKK